MWVRDPPPVALEETRIAGGRTGLLTPLPARGLPGQHRPPPPTLCFCCGVSVGATAGQVRQPSVPAPLVKREHVRLQSGYDRARPPGGAFAGVGQRQTASPVKRRCAFESRRRLLTKSKVLKSQVQSRRRTLDLGPWTLDFGLVIAASAQPVSCRIVNPVMVVRVHPPQLSCRLE
jgi:hypothetical protein